MAIEILFGFLQQFQFTDSRKSQLLMLKFSTCKKIIIIIILYYYYNLKIINNNINSLETLIWSKTNLTSRTFTGKTFKRVIHNTSIKPPNTVRANSETIILKNVRASLIRVYTFWYAREYYYLTIDIVNIPTNKEIDIYDW